MRAGSLNRQVSIDTKVQTQDATNGSVITTWQPFLARIWGEFEFMVPARGEIVTRQVQLDKTQARLRLRWRDDLDGTMRVTLHGDTDRLFQIVGGPADVPAEGRKSRIELYLEELTSSGDAP